MKTYRIVDIIDGIPTFDVPMSEVWQDAKKGGAYKRLDPIEFITDRQRRWYKGVALRELVENDENGETLAWWDTEVKRFCNGLKYLKKEIFYLDNGSGVGRLTTKGVGKKNMTLFIEEILSQAMVKGWPVSPPDSDLRKE